MKNKKNIGIVFGGRSFEHEVSLVSARSIINALDKQKYKIILIGLTKDGYWLKGESAKKLLAGKKVKEKGEFIPTFLEQIDVFFPVLHGPFGEDGTIQGFFETLKKPYIGANVLGSAIGINKVIQKIIWQNYHLPVVKFQWFLYKNWLENKQKLIQLIEKEIKYPCFVKPVNAGSSIGISKPHNRQELLKAVNLASKYDHKILIEKAVKNVTEVEVSVLGNDHVIASCVGEIIPSNEFYDYEAKYVDDKSVTLIPAKISKKLSKDIQKLAIQAYKLVGCQGMARVDFLLSGQKIYLNEINTIPGFTSISMYPKLWQKSGLSYVKLLDKLINLSINRFKEKEKLHFDYNFKGRIKWKRKLLIQEIY